MSPAVPAALHHWAALWLPGATRATWQGGAAILIAWAITTTLPNLSPRARGWLWRLALLKLLVAFVWATPVDLPLLPASAAHASAAAAVSVAVRWRRCTS